MFHDGDWEDNLLMHALTGKAFFVGAVGSRKTQARRKARLIRAGLTEQQVDRLHGPIGLIPSMRDASMLAISTLSQIVSEYTKVTEHV